jgi:hypothetical protein
MTRTLLSLFLIALLCTAVSADIIVTKKQVYDFVHDAQKKNPQFRKKSDSIIQHLIDAFKADARKEK